MLPLASRCISMNNLANSLDVSTPSASAKRGFTKDTGAACRERASADLLRSVTMITANQRLSLERSAESWTLRAVMLERMETSFEKRRALDAASRQYERDHVRL